MFDVLPLELLQPSDPKQMAKVYDALRMVPELVMHYLLQFVFPSPVTRHQEIKLTACGVDLGSDMLFKHRLGFSGTPSSLLPRSLQPCLVEPGSDAKYVRVLGSSEYVKHTCVADWNVRKLLTWVATHSPRFHALIDTGALVTGMENLQVAEFLLEHLSPESGMEGVVYLDTKDHKMVLLRGQPHPIALEECGLPWNRRFTFYDQVRVQVCYWVALAGLTCLSVVAQAHTTGMDIKQCIDACAAVTLGKDMTLRDYAQGVWRMRQIAVGQTVHLYIVREIEQLIRQVANTNNMAMDVVAWLVVQGVRSEQLQFMMLTKQVRRCWSWCRRCRRCSSQASRHVCGICGAWPYPQNLALTWRRTALRDLAASSRPQGDRACRFASNITGIDDADGASVEDVQGGG